MAETSRASLPRQSSSARQHDSRVLSTSATGLTITLLNNNNYEYGDLTQVNITLGEQITLNTAAKTVTAAVVYYDAADPIATVAEGGYQSLPNGDVFLDYGLNPQLIEYNSAGAVVYTAVFGVLGDGSYRGFRFPFVGTPTTKPDLVACKNATSGTTNLWASWNGATEYNAWEVLGCDGGVKVNRTGFETEYSAKTCALGVAQVEALSSTGKVLGTSKLVTVKDC